jgi:hypothetical protein
MTGSFARRILVMFLKWSIEECLCFFLFDRPFVCNR